MKRGSRSERSEPLKVTLTTDVADPAYKAWIAEDRKRRRREIMAVALGLISPLAFYCRCGRHDYFLVIALAIEVGILWSFSSILWLTHDTHNWYQMADERSKEIFAPPAGYPASMTWLALGAHLIVAFGGVYYTVSLRDPAAFLSRLSRIDALYFSLATFTTTGFGDISPVSQVARAMVSVQMTLTFLLVIVVVVLVLPVKPSRARILRGKRKWTKR